MPALRTMGRSGAALAALAVLTVPAVAFAAVSGTGPAPAPSSAVSPSPAAQAAREGSPSSAVDRVAAFYGAYVDALTGKPDTTLAKALRSHFLTPEFRARLEKWERDQGVDGVFRAQNTPRAWRVEYDNSGAGHTWTLVRLTWGDDSKPTYTYLAVQSDLSTRLISDIKEENTKQ
ncbi:hypothetical protein GCM10010218_10380 [Streptomyces mashuensis]|uniref:Secreted protein n=1 Tax=Streptomyces mashuensis TaxID=33904 RepID=A0A919AXA1_9ACTN|nr:hypothetical protein [Streptomyces mashuensis]GHF30973.1 hypothetical protein GCM10010218_10380 [Streptomyces mashuensis]